MAKRFFWKLFPFFLLLSITSLLLLAFSASTLFKKYHLRQIEFHLKNIINISSHQILPFIEESKVNRANDVIKNFTQGSNLRLTVINSSGTVLCDSEEDPKNMDNHLTRTEVYGAKSYDKGVSIRYSKTVKKKMMYLAMPFNINNNDTLIIRASYPLSFIDEALFYFYFHITIITLIILFSITLFTIYFSKKISTPIEKIKTAAEKFAKGNFDSELNVKDTVEFESLSSSFNYMSKELNLKIKNISEQRQEFETILSSMKEGVLAIDKEEKIMSINQAGINILMLPSNSFRGKSLLEAIRNEDLHKIFIDTIKTQKSLEQEFEIGIASRRIIHTTSSLLLKGEKEILGVVIVLSDITRLKKLESMRSDFVANVSHELKTPITSIKGYIETLLEGAIDDKDNANEFLNIIFKQAERLNSIVDDLLILSRIEEEEKKQNLIMEKVQLKNILTAAMDLCRKKASLKKIELVLSCKDDFTVKVNSQLIEQAVVNIIDNAIKFSPENSKVSISTVCEENNYLINITDNGPGIAKEHISRLFERFYRVDKARSRKMGGTGLGLAIVKHIVKAHGGNVYIESKIGIGSTFSISLAKYF